MTHATLTAYGCVQFNLQNGNERIVKTHDVLFVQDISIPGIVTVTYGKHNATLNENHVMIQGIPQGEL